MEFRVLEYFLAIAREESISSAAEYLHITQPTLSRQIHDLEEELGKKLFIRGNRKITLTDDGMLLRKRAEEIIQLMEKTQKEISTTNEELHGDIYIGGGETKGMHIIAKAINIMQSIHPNVTFHLHSGNSIDVGEKIENGLLEFGLMIEPVDKSRYDYITIPHKDTWGILLRKDHPLASKKLITIDEIKDYPIIISAQINHNNELISYLGRDLRQLNKPITYNLLYNAAIVCEETNYLVLTLDNIVNTMNTDLVFIPLYPTLKASMVLVWKKYSILSRPTETFLNIVKDLVQNAQKQGEKY